MPTETHTTHVVSCGACGEFLTSGGSIHFLSLAAAVAAARVQGWLIHDDGGAPVCPTEGPTHDAERAYCHAVPADAHHALQRGTH